MKKKAKKRKATKKVIPSAPSSTAIVRIPLPANKPWELNREEVVLVKNQICKGASDEEFQMCLARARHHRLDPLKQQIWFVPRWDKHAENADGSMGRKTWVAQVGITGLRHIASRDHKAEYGTEDDAVFGPMIDVHWKGGALKVPSSASVAVWKKGATRPTVATVFWEEIYPNVDHAPLVRQMPRLMLGKCASAQTNRKAYPETGGLYIAEEFAGQRPDYTPDGRRIIYDDKELPERASHEAAVQTGERKVEELREKLGKTDAPRKSAPVAKEATVIPDLRKPGPQPANMGVPVPDLPATVDNPAAEVKGTVEIDHTTEASPIVRGDISGLLEMIQKHCTATWGKDEWWHITPRDVETVKAMCRQLGFKIIETVPKAPPKAAPPTTTPAHKSSPTEPVVVCGVVERVFATTASNKAPMRQVTILTPDKKKPTYGCFEKALFPYLDDAKGAIEAYTTTNGKYLNLVGLKSIVTTKGLKRFDSDGKTLVIQRSEQEAGQKTLY